MRGGRKASGCASGNINMFVVGRCGRERVVGMPTRGGELEGKYWTLVLSV